MSQAVPVDVVMPRLSDSMEEGTILQWFKQEGEEVQRGDELVEIETDKANMAYESEADGVLVEILAVEGETLPLGRVIARIGEPGLADSDGNVRNAAAPADAPATTAPADAPATTAPADAPATTVERRGRAKASPLARRVARGLGVDLTTLEGSGPDRRIMKMDVERAAAEAAPPATEELETAKGKVESVEPTKLQQTVARRMSESKAVAPHFYLSTEIDMTEAVALRTRLRELMREGEPAPSFNDLVVKACATALREHPRVNGAYRDGRFEIYSRVNVGIAVATQDALVVPTIFDADRKRLVDIGRESRELAAKVRDGTITPPELSGGNFTVSNLGMYGISNFSAVINPPQSAILAVGAIEKRARWDPKGERFVPRDVMEVTLACDHRILYGADAAEFLAKIRRVLEEPLALAL